MVDSCESLSISIAPSKSYGVPTHVISLTDGPKFVSRPANRTVILGSQLVLFCHVLSNPAATVSWYKVDSLNVSLSTTNPLVINKTSESDAGEYVCRARNSETGKGVNASVLVNLQCRYLIITNNGWSKTLCDVPLCLMGEYLTVTHFFSIFQTNSGIHAYSIRTC